MYPVVRRLSGFRWSGINRRVAACCFAAVAVVFAGFLVLPAAAAIPLGALSVIASGYISARRLVQLVSPQRLPRPIAWFLQWRRLSP
jgi:PST family polysaccharide transporter